MVAPSGSVHLTGPVLVFDSGVGGLSIVQALQERLPDLPLAYACDNAAFPYGTKPDAWLLQRLPQVIEAVIQAVQPALIVVACNTASTLGIQLLRETFDLPFVGVVPAIKPAALLTRTGHLGLLATQATLSRDYTQDLIQRFASDCEVTQVGSHALVDLAEKALAGAQVDSSQLNQILEPLLNEPRIDTVVLGCTHFPLLKTQLAAVASEAGADHWQWVDSGAAIARRVASLITPLDADAPAFEQAGTTWLTGPLPKSSQLPLMLNSLGLNRIQSLPALPLPALQPSV